MTLLTLLVGILVLVVVGYVVARIPNMDGTLRTIISVVIGVVALLLVLQFFGAVNVLNVRMSR